MRKFAVFLCPKTFGQDCMYIKCSEGNLVFFISAGSLLHADIPHDLIVSGSKDCSVKVWDLKTSNASLLTLHGHTACVNCVAVESNIAASASDDCSIRAWDISTV